MSVTSADIKIKYASGMHARPAVAFTKLAKTFDCDIQCIVVGRSINFNAKSIKQAMGAKVRQGQTLRIEACGPEANVAVDALVELVKLDFQED